MTTLNENYKKNIDIMKENLKRGMKKGQALQVIDNFREQFIYAGLYNGQEKEFITQLRAEIVSHFSGIKIVSNLRKAKNE